MDSNNLLQWCWLNWSQRDQAGATQNFDQHVEDSWGIVIGRTNEHRFDHTIKVVDSRKYLLLLLKYPYLK